MARKKGMRLVCEKVSSKKINCLTKGMVCELFWNKETLFYEGACKKW